MEFAYLEILIALISGLVLGIFISRTLLQTKASKGIASSADNKLKLENEVLSDRVKQLEAKIKTLEKALEKI